jgi:cytochrome c551/c552
MKRRNIVLLVILVIIVGIQFVRIDKNNPESNPEKDFIALENPPEEVKVMLKNACYDCHSHQTVYPWYTNVAPFSWVIGKHITEGRKHLNFSTWADYKRDKQLHMLEEAAEEVKEGHMPIPNYTWMHSEAKLSDADRSKMTDWLESKMNILNQIN